MYSIEAEQSVLGAILLNPALIHETSLVDENFYDKSNQIIFAKMIELRTKGINIDPVTLSASIGDGMTEVGGISYLIKLMDSTPTTAEIKWHEKIVRDKYIVRTGMASVQELCSTSVEDPNIFAEQMRIIAESMSTGNEEGGLRHVRQGAMEHSEQLNEKINNPKNLGYSTVGVDMDNIIGKWQRQSFNVIAARPSVGKTAAMLNNALINAKEGVTAGIFSLEMPEVQLFDRMIASECLLDGEKIRNADLQTEDDWSKYTTGLSSLAELPIYIDDRPGLTIQQIRSEVRRLKKDHGEIIIFIDYLQLIKSGLKMNNRNEEVGYISSSLKQMARENDCPVIALAQLSRSVEQRQDKRPMMSDLRESGNIEQDADTISFLYRDDYYNKETELKNIIEIITVKNRNGKVGTAEMVNLKQFGKFANYERYHG